LEQRIVEFIAGLRAAGVRVSLAESNDAFHAVEQVGVVDRDTFRAALRTTLVKEASDLPLFERLFPLYFGSGGPPLVNPQEALSPEQRRMLAAALRALLDQMGQTGRPSPAERRSSGQAGQLGQLMQLLRWLLSGQSPSQEELDQAGRSAGLPMASHPSQQAWMARRMLQAMGWQRLQELLQQLWQELAKAGMSREAIEQLRQMMEANQEALAEQVGQYAGASIARQMAAQSPPHPGPDLMNRPFQSLSETEADELRDQIRRLAALLRSRAALRQKRANSGTLDAKRTLRANLRYGGVPLEMHYKRRHLKPKLALICDVSTSVRHCAEFLLRLIYELQDQVAKARSFAFISDIEEISQDFTTFQPDVAVEHVLTRLPAGYYNTDLGHSLDSFCHDYLDAVDHRTTVILVGDGRNNFNDPRVDLVQTLKRRARRVIWLNPESPHLWGSGDSDMADYLPLCDSVQEVGNLAQLAAAVDHLLTSR
jgi:uncharacterized protein with von Willebrand factor type A (vWA) domain